MNKKTTVEIIKILPACSKVGTSKRAFGRKWKVENIGWVAGIIYSDGNEWLYNKNDWCSLWKQDYVIFKTMEKAIAHAKKFKPNIKYQKFVRPYQKETLLPLPIKKP